MTNFHAQSTGLFNLQEYRECDRNLKIKPFQLKYFWAILWKGNLFDYSWADYEDGKCKRYRDSKGFLTAMEAQSELNRLPITFQDNCKIVRYGIPNELE